MVDNPTAKHHGVCPICEGYGGGDAPEGHEFSGCEGSCPECWCTGCHDGHDFPADRLAELPDSSEGATDGDPCGSWLAYELLHP